MLSACIRCFLGVIVFVLTVFFLDRVAVVTSITVKCESSFCRVRF